MTDKTFGMTLKSLIGNRDEAVSFWITATLCVLSTVLMVSTFFVTYAGLGWKLYQLIQGILIQGIFVSTFFTLWTPKRGTPPSYRIGWQVASLLVLCAAWGIYALDPSNEARKFYHFSFWDLDSPIGSVAGVFLSPLSIFSPGGKCHFLGLASLGSLAIFLFLFSAGTSWSHGKKLEDTRIQKESQEAFFIHILQKRMLQAVGISILLVIAGGTFWGASGLWALNVRWSGYLVEGALVLIVELFCPLYSILMVRKDQKKRAKHHQEENKDCGLTAYNHPEVMMVFLCALVLIWCITCISQVAAFLNHRSSAGDPHIVTLIGLLGVYIYTFTTHIGQIHIFSKILNSFRKFSPFLYISIWSLACCRAIQFAYKSCLTPFQIWIGFVFICLGIFNLLLIFQRKMRIPTILYTATATCIVGMLSAQLASFGICEQIIGHFLITNEAITLEKGTRTIQALPNPEKCSVQDFKRFVRALNILQELAPQRLRTIFGPNLDAMQGILQGAQDAAWQIIEANKKKTEETSELPNIGELLTRNPIIVNGKRYENLSEAPEDVQKIMETLKNKNLSETLLKRPHGFANDLDAILALLGLGDSEIQSKKEGWYCIKRGTSLDNW